MRVTSAHDPKRTFTSLIMNANNFVLFILSFLFLPIAIAGSVNSKTEKALESAGLVVSSKLNPNNLLVDLNGDQKVDIAVFIENKKTKKNGICILHSGAEKCIVLGAGSEFYNGGDNFDWVDHWEMLEPGVTWESTFKPDGDRLGKRKVILENRSLKLCVDEGGCYVITFTKAGYKWIHQGD